MLDISKLTDDQQFQLIENRWKESESLWEIVSKAYAKNKRVWENNPEWLDTISAKRSKARDNRTFLSMESTINSLTGRPSRPNVIPANETKDAMEIANDIQDFFLAKYRDLGMKAKMRRGLRFLHLARLVAFKIFWNQELDDFDTRLVDPRNVRFSAKATSMYDTEFAIERIPDIPVSQLIELFPKKEKIILKKSGYTEKQVLIDNPKIEYREAWIGDYVIYEFQQAILDWEWHPYWDWEGINLTANELSKFQSSHGVKRRYNGAAFKKNQEKRKSEKEKYENYLYNHFDKPYVPYVFGTVLAIEDKPIGDTSLVEQVDPLQVEVDKRKRQISDNAEMMNGVYKIDTRFVKITKAQAQAAKSDPRGMWYGKGVRDGITIDTGKELPAFVQNELTHSIQEIDNIFGTMPTFRGERGQSETATGRAILREQSMQRQDEPIDLIDTIHYQIYNWWFQMIKVMYTESHYIKPIGSEKAKRVIQLTRDDLSDGIEIQIIPGQIIPTDRLYRAERAKEEAVAHLIDPLTYFEETERDNPMELAKRFEMYKINPFSIIELNDEDLQKIQQAQQLFSPNVNPTGTGKETMPGTGGGGDPRAQKLAELRQQAVTITQSPEFQALPLDKQRNAITQIKQQVEQLSNAK